MKVWTPGLHGFRAKRLDAGQVMIPPHIPILELDKSNRASRDNAGLVVEKLLAMSHTVSAFSYTLSALHWDESEKRFSILPDAADKFEALRMRIQDLLGNERDFRERYQPSLLLASGNSKSPYELEEEFHLMNGDSFSLNCRATEMEVYRFQAGNWLLSAEIPIAESAEN